MVKVCAKNHIYIIFHFLNHQNDFSFFLTIYENTKAYSTLTICNIKRFGSCDEDWTAGILAIINSKLSIFIISPSKNFIVITNTASMGFSYRYSLNSTIDLLESNEEITYKNSKKKSF